MTATILMYPALKRKNFLDADGEMEKIDASEMQEEHLIHLADHYMAEIALHMKNHNFAMNEALLKDMQVATDFLASAMYRNVGKYHHLQDAVDDIEFDIDDEEIVDEE